MIQPNKTKRLLKLGMASLAILAGFIHQADAQLTGPSSSQSPYLVPVHEGVKTTAFLTANDSINGYKLSGIPDGLGAYDNGNGTFTLLVNHEILNNLGVVRAHGSIGAFVSKWVINKQDLSVVSGTDQIQNVKLWNGTGYDTYNAANPSSLAAFSRFCSADLPPVSAFYNATTGNGTTARIFMNGEEVTDGRAMAHILTGPEAGNSYQLPAIGKMSFENQVANPVASDKTIVANLDDGSITTSNVYFYIGTKTNSGSEIEKAGLTNGKLYGVKISGYPQERVSSTVINDPPAPGTHFDLVDLGPVANLTGAGVDAASLAAGATYFSRSEDGVWNPSSLSDFYFNTTDQIDQVKDAIGTQVGRSRLWHLHFSDISNPEAGGTVEAVLDGTEGQNMLDNLTMDKSGHIVDLEDVGNSAHNGKVWDYQTGSDVLTLLAKHDPARFGDINIPATLPYNQDEESSGVIDVQSLLGPGMFLLDDQAHYTTGIPAAIVEGGQLLAVYNPLSSDCSTYEATVTPAGNATFCSNSTITLYANSGYGLTYQWYRSGATLVGATNAEYTTDKKGDYYVMVSNGTCSWTSPTTIVARLNTPAVTLQARNGTDLCVNGSVSLKAMSSTTTGTVEWFKDGSLLSGVTSRLIIVTEPGSYVATITNTNGCSASSSAVVVTQSCKVNNEKTEIVSPINIYPNPNNGNFVVEINTDGEQTSSATIEVVNMLGKTVYSGHVIPQGCKWNQEIKLDASIAEGNYLVRVVAGSKIYSGIISYHK